MVLLVKLIFISLRFMCRFVPAFITMAIATSTLTSVSLLLLLVATGPYQYICISTSSLIGPQMPCRSSWTGPELIMANASILYTKHLCTIWCSLNRVCTYCLGTLVPWMPWGSRILVLFPLVHEDTSLFSHSWYMWLFFPLSFFFQ